ncbi:hypothetical protein AB0950_30015 [Streptomyces sp. NPDC007189]|uniref:hypothetical protein n=1 Tax=unclassified Streptomyces TaxID=2593676 RepID=UPI0033EE3B4A
MTDFVLGFRSALPWATALTTAAPDGLARAARMIRADLTPLTAGDGSARVPVTAHLVTVTAPGS